MTKMQRVGEFFAGIVMLLLSLIIFIDPWHSYRPVVFLLGISFSAEGIRQLIYYFTMARHMVGGKYSLYLGLVMFDLGAFTLSLTDVPRPYVMLYLAAVHAFSGAVDILRALESRRAGASWKVKFTSGVVYIAIAVLCLVFIGSANAAVYIYASGLLYGAVFRFINAFRRTAIVYIQ